MRRVLIVTPPRIDSASRFPPSNAIRTVQSGSRPPPLSRSLQGRGLEASPMYGRRDRWDACKLHGETAVDRPPGRAAEARETLGERAVRAAGRRSREAPDGRRAATRMPWTATAPPRDPLVRGMAPRRSLVGGGDGRIRASAVDS